MYPWKGESMVLASKERMRGREREREFDAYTYRIASNFHRVMNQSKIRCKLLYKLHTNNEVRENYSLYGTKVHVRSLRLHVHVFVKYNLTSIIGYSSYFWQGIMASLKSHFIIIMQALCQGHWMIFEIIMRFISNPLDVSTLPAISGLYWCIVRLR